MRPYGIYTVFGIQPGKAPHSRGSIHPLQRMVLPAEVQDPPSDHIEAKEDGIPAALQGTDGDVVAQIQRLDRVEQDAPQFLCACLRDSSLCRDRAFCPGVSLWRRDMRRPRLSGLGSCAGVERDACKLKPDASSL